MYDPGIGRWISEDPIGFEAGDSNLYRYVANRPVTHVDPSGLQSGVNNHNYPLYLGGSPIQPVIQLRTEADHVAFHNYFRQRGLGYGDEGRRAWAALTEPQRRAHITAALRAARVPQRVIDANLAIIMRGATPGVRVPRPAGYPGGIIRLSAIGLGLAAAADILINPSVVRAEGPDPTWRGLDPNRRGRVELAEVVIVYDEPEAWNFWGQRTEVQRFEQGARLDLGTMTVAEARAFEGVTDVIDSCGGFSPAPTGYRRLFVVRNFAYFQAEGQGIEVDRNTLMPLWSQPPRVQSAMPPPNMGPPRP